MASTNRNFTHPILAMLELIWEWTKVETIWSVVISSYLIKASTASSKAVSLIPYFRWNQNTHSHNTNPSFPKIQFKIEFWKKNHKLNRSKNNLNEIKADQKAIRTTRK